MATIIPENNKNAITVTSSILNFFITPSIMKMQQAFSSYDRVSTAMEIGSTVFIEEGTRHL